MATSTQTTVKVEQLSPLVDEGDLKLASGNSSCICSVKINATQGAFNFAYVNYSTMRDAQEAVTVLNGKRLHGTNISAKLHTASSKCSLPSFLGVQHTVKVDQLPLHVREEDLMAAFSTYGNVVSTKINTTQTALNYAYVNYTNQESALEVTKHLNGATLWGKPIVVKVHRPENGQSRCENSELHQSFSGQSYTVKVEQIPHHVTQEMLSEIFGSCGTVRSTKINRTQSTFNYAYVNYLQLQSAKEAVQKWNGSKVWGSIIAVKIQNASGKECVLIKPDTKTPVVQILPKMQRDEKYTLIVDHLSGLITEKELCNLFHKHGELRGLKLFETQTAFNYAYVDYSNIEDAEMAVRELDGAEQYGVAMEVRLFTSSNKSRRLMDEDAACRDQMDIFYGHQCTLNVECLPKSVQNRDLWDTFTPFGLVTSAKLIVTETEFNSAQMEYAELEDAEAAVHELDGSTVFSDGSPICVKIDTAHCTSAATLAEADFTGNASFYRNTADQLQFASTTNSAQHSTVKVSLSNKPGTNISINGEDLQDIFGRCGKIQCLPVINQGNPPYAYINFESPIGAQAACALNGLAVMEHLLQVKLVTKQTETLDIKNVPCDPLVCKLMFSHFKADVEAIRQDVIVQLHRSKSAIKLTGEEKQTTEVVKKIQELVLKIETHIVKRKVSLPCHHLPSFTIVLLENIIENIEMRHLVSFKFLCADGQPMHITECFNKLCSITQASNDALQISDFSTFLHDTPVINENSNQKHTWWWWEDKRKGYVEYSADISAIITKHFLSSPNVPLQLLIGSRSYNIDLSAMIQTNQASGFIRRIRHKTKVQHSTKNNSTSLHSSRCSLCIEVSGQVDSLDPAISDLNCELKKLVVETKCELHQVDPIAAALLDITGQYCVEARVSGTDLIVRGIKEYVDKVMLRIQKECISYLKQKSCVQSCDVPDDWLPQSKKVVLVSIQQGTPEWNEVTDLFGRTLVSSQITKLERIQNKWLWEKFVFAKQRMVEKNKGQVMEMKLFHGTKNTRPKEIFKSEQGFDPRYSSQGMWGTGAYFAVNAKYSDDYSHISGSFKQMILARVLTGDTYHCAPDSSLKMPPLKPCLKVQGAFENERYDSVSGHTMGSDIFVIYDNEKAYPAYLITYM